MDIKTLYDADFIYLTSAKTAFDTLSTAFGQHVESWQLEVVKRLNNSQWTGTASDHAKARIQLLENELQAAKQELGLVSTALRDASEGFAAAQAHLVNALDDAKAKKLNVAPDGRITWDNDPASANFAGKDAEAQAQEISRRITAALTEADHADQTINARLAHLATNASNGTGLDAATVKADTDAAKKLEEVPAAGTDPNNVKAWWNSLTDEQQHRMILNHPDQVGNLDGVPAAARDQANRINLQRGKQDLQRQLDGLGPEPSHFIGFGKDRIENPEYTKWKSTRDDLQDKMHGVTAIEDRLNKPVDASHPPTFLLGFDTNGKGHAIIAVNNPDTADNVSTYVPGTGARLGSIGSDINRSDLMVQSADEANRKAGDKSTNSSITWVGYDAPQNIVPEAADDTYAKNAEDKLRNFELGLHATHDGKIANNTVLAHSYGTTTVGYAMRDKGLPVDNAVLIASPGCGVENAKELRIDPSHVYAAQSPADAIGWAAAVDPGGMWDNIVDNVSTSWGMGDGDHHLIHGRQTTVPQFGAHVLPTDPEAGHSDYWNDGSPTLTSMGQIIAGKQVS
ncbi:alpha/beta hydrolase family protein [Streptomyces sp. 1114.5]|uniref:alpha/beta hydrolase n=1 Tax=unclassified Streptomyces TaxID=2593676 RepID=UPI000BCD476B|nr:MULTISPECIES: alpha/beta hydrolase [unclassified Streptomyces]RKT09571.1 alpha/beta hydrolase family protein [Streptomyces sp. 1114.5]SOB88423.1 Alpha/beta hydrolase [Streptomyces sp. 1331.2]